MQNEASNLAIENELLLSENAALRAENQYLKEQLAWFQRQVFGKKSERIVDLPCNTDFLPGLEPEELDEPEAKTAEVGAHTRRRAPRKGSCTLDLPDSLERVERTIDVPESERILPDGAAMVRIGEDRSEKLAVRPAEFFVLVTVRPKYAALGLPELGVLQEPMPGTLIEGSKFDASFLAYLVEEKLAFHMPLYRIQEKLAGRDIRVTRQSMSGVLKTCGERLVPLYDLMTERLFAQKYIFTDSTPINILDKEKCRIGQVYTYIGGLPNAPPYHVYQFCEDRAHCHPTDFLEPFEGVFHADAFAAYEKLHVDPDRNIRWAACWAHARRYFENATFGDEEFREWVLRHMRYLFMFERIAWKRSSEERARIRLEHEKPVVEAIFRRLREALFSPKLLPKSKMATAVGYMLAREENFTLYLRDPNVRMENNTAERGLRKLTIGRKNWMFVGSAAAGKSMATLFSLVQTCRAMDIRPWEYLTDIFERFLDHPANRLEELLPDQWKAARESSKAEAAATMPQAV